MSHLNFGFIADTHLRNTQYGLSARGDDFLSALKSAIDEFHRRGVRLIIHGGDLLDEAELQSTLFAQLRDIDGYLQARGMCMLAITGNHDATGTPWHGQVGRNSIVDGARWDSPEPGLFNLDWKTITIQGAVFSGIPFCAHQVLQDRMNFLKLTHGESGIDFLVWHGMVAEFFAGADALPAGELAKHEWVRNVLLGDIHIHKFYTLRPSGGIIGYPGSTEMCKSNEDIVKRGIHATYDTIEKKVIGWQETPIATRDVWRLRIETETAMEEVVERLRVIPRDARGPLIVSNVSESIVNYLGRLRAVAPANTVFLDPRFISDATQDILTVDFNRTVSDATETDLDPVSIIRTVLPGLEDGDNFNALANIARHPEAAASIIETRISEILAAVSSSPLSKSEI